MFLMHLIYHLDVNQDDILFQHDVVVYLYQLL
ncbi:unnamed protein product [Schistosoma curassoni]|uniref:Uncharacterized protein n=1 Tax=Schistosoma curassoni TaxID=6186 RepID=A0A183JXD5_9TREM|nr:unnamed protein product [Schistosoma curassoni]